MVMADAALGATRTIDVLLHAPMFSRRALSVPSVLLIQHLSHQLCDTLAFALAFALLIHKKLRLA
jgi:hypothetical protein